MTISCLTALTDRVQRIDHCGRYVDIVHSSRGTIRVGSMPDIAKFMYEHGFREEIVVVDDWESSQTGDNRTGEEFVLWQAQIRGGLLKKYVGLPHNVRQLHSNLSRIFPYFFDDKRLAIVRKRWLSNWFQANYAEPCFVEDSLKIRCENGNILILDGSKLIYDKLSPSFATDAVAGDKDVERVLAGVARDQKARDRLEIIPIGCGNGLYGTVANSVVRFEKTVLWIDPCGYPAHTLARHNIHWDDITHFLFTHNHEDHVQGFSACIARARKMKRKITLMVTKGVLEILKKLYLPLFPDLDGFLRIVFLEPGTSLVLGNMTIKSRWNHHILPYGTVGLKISAGGQCFGYSGDTKYDESLNTLLQKKELTASWFKECDLIFHEIEFDNPHSVHSHWKQVEALQKEVPGKVLGYHTQKLPNSPFELAVEGRRYLL